MVRQTCCAIGGHSAEAYGFIIMREGLTYQERLHQRVQFPVENADLVVGYLETHSQVQHGVGWGDLRYPPPPRMIPERIRSPSPRHHTISHAQWWGAPVGPRSKAPSRFPS